MTSRFTTMNRLHSHSGGSQVKTSFILYLDQYEPIKNLTSEQKGKLLDVLFLYNLGEDPIIEDPIINLVFGFFKTTFDRDTDKYLKRCDKNRENIRKRWNKDSTTVYDGIQPHTKHTDSDSDSGTDSDSDKPKEPTLLEILKQKIKDHGYTEIQDKIIEFFKYRQAKPKRDRYKSEKGLNGLFRHIKECSESGLNPLTCLERTMEEEWKTPKPEYFNKPNNVYPINQPTGTRIKTDEEMNAK